MMANWRRHKVLIVYYAGLLAWLGTTAMHIPDGYLSPATCAALYATSVPFWYVALRRVARIDGQEHAGSSRTGESPWRSAARR